MAYTVKDSERDRVAFLQMSEEAERSGNPILAGLYRVEAANSLKRVGMKRQHCPSLGPYTTDNPPFCVNCRKLREQWFDGEECVAP